MSDKKTKTSPKRQPLRHNSGQSPIKMAKLATTTPFNGSTSSNDEYVDCGPKEELIPSEPSGSERGSEAENYLEYESEDDMSEEGTRIVSDALTDQRVAVWESESALFSKKLENILTVDSSIAEKEHVVSTLLDLNIEFCLPTVINYKGVQKDTILSKSSPLDTIGPSNWRKDMQLVIESVMTPLGPAPKGKYEQGFSLSSLLNKVNKLPQEQRAYFSRLHWTIQAIKNNELHNSDSQTKDVEKLRTLVDNPRERV